MSPPEVGRHNNNQSEKFEDTKGVIRSHKSNDKTTQWPKNKRTSNGLQNTTLKTKD